MTLLTKNFDLLKERVEAHVAADEVIQGTYWEDGKGCFIGCTVHSECTEEAVELFGLPVAVMRISEGVFEALPFDEAKAFFAALPDAIGQNGKDLSRVHWAFLAAELRALPQTTEDVQAAIEPVIAGMDLQASGGQWPADAARAAAHAAARAAARAAHAARDAAYAAYAAARDAAYAAYADDVYADYAARAAAHAAAYADDVDVYADYAARAAARDAARLRQRDTLLRLISDAPKGQNDE